MIEVDVAHQLARFRVEARFTTEGRLTALFGRSGAGKTTLVNLIGGLIRPDRGRIAVDGRVLVDTEAGAFLPPHRRRIGYVFQEGRLFPHLTVRQNLLYGHWFTARAERWGRLEPIVDLLGIAHLLAQRPRTLSGGEKQRVAIGRALLASPRLLLMDEPLASLDGERKAEILPYIERLRDELRVPIVYVSHSIEEVTRLATTLVLMSEGQVAAVGPTAAVMARLDLFPLTGRYQAGAVLDTQVTRHDAATGLTTLAARAGPIHVPHLDLPPGAPVRLRIRARDVMLATHRPEGFSALNILPGRVVELGPAPGPVVDVALDCGGDRLIARITRRSVAALDIRPGRELFAVIKTVALDHRGLGRPGPAHGEELDG
jgi:molybdate transport system ATP-binding protein